MVARLHVPEMRPQPYVMSEQTGPNQKHSKTIWGTKSSTSFAKILHWLCLFAAFSLFFSSSFPSSWALTSQEAPQISFSEGWCKTQSSTGQDFQAKRHLYAGHLWPHGSERGPLPHVTSVCLCKELHYITISSEPLMCQRWVHGQHTPQRTLGSLHAPRSHLVKLDQYATPFRLRLTLSRVPLNTYVP